MSLLLAIPFSEFIIEDNHLAQIVFSFAFLSVSPFIPAINDWIYDSRKYRWIHSIFIILTAVYLFSCADARERGSEKADAMAIVSVWLIIYVVSYFLTSERRSENANTPFIFQDLSWILGIFSAIFVMMLGIIGGSILIDPETGPFIGQLIGLTIWIFGWYWLRRGKPQLYRWRNFLFVLVVANWSSLAVSLASPAAAIVGPIILILGIILFVVPNAKDRT